MTVHFTLGQYQRHDRNIWYAPFGAQVTDPEHIAELEAEYRRCQQVMNGYHHAVDRGTVKRVIQAVQRGPQRKAREWKGPERA